MPNWLSRRTSRLPGSDAIDDVGPAVVTMAACSDATEPAPEQTRVYRLGFSTTSPVPTVESVLATVDAWASYADIALVTHTVPWRALLTDSNASFLIRRDLYPLVNLYRNRSLPIIIQLDVTDGLAREREAPELVALGRKHHRTGRPDGIPRIPPRHRQYPDAGVPRPGHGGQPRTGRSAAGSVRRGRDHGESGAQELTVQGSDATLFVSFQVETAWGRLAGDGNYVGIERERADFPFIQAAGLSSYPFLGGFDEPEDVPLNYYARLTEPSPMPGLVVEGGWSSASVGGVGSSPEKQARWIRRQMQLADHAALHAVTQITFTDLDLSSYPVPPESILPLFAHLGLVDTELQPKPALAEWQTAFRRPLNEPDTRWTVSSIPGL